MFFCAPLHPGFCQMLEGGEITLKGGKINYKYSTFSDPLLLLTTSLRLECVCLVVPSGERERVGGDFLDVLRRDMACIFSWNLRLTCETEVLKVERSFPRGGYKNHQWILTHFANIVLLFLCFAATWEQVCGHIFTVGIFLCSALWIQSIVKPWSCQMLLYYRHRIVIH